MLFGALPVDWTTIVVFIIHRNTTFRESINLQSNAAINHFAIFVFPHRNFVIKIFRANTCWARSFGIKFLTFVINIAVNVTCCKLFYVITTNWLRRTTRFFLILVDTIYVFDSLRTIDVSTSEFSNILSLMTVTRTPTRYCWINLLANFKCLIFVEAFVFIILKYFRAFEALNKNVYCRDIKRYSVFSPNCTTVSIVLKRYTSELFVVPWNWSTNDIITILSSKFEANNIR